MNPTLNSDTEGGSRLAVEASEINSQNDENNPNNNDYNCLSLKNKKNLHFYGVNNNLHFSCVLVELLAPNEDVYTVITD